MKYSLRSLMIVVGVACLILGAWSGRVEYLRRMADFHDQESARYASRLQSLFFKPGGDEFETCTQKMNFHEEYARLFRETSGHPWRLVSEPQRELSRESDRRPDVVNRHEIVLPNSSAPAPNPSQP